MTLAEIAAAMRARVDARAFACAERRLGGGLHIRLTHMDGVYVLTASRPRVFPSETEVAMLRRVFGTPDDAQFSRQLPRPFTIMLRWGEHSG